MDYCENQGEGKHYNLQKYLDKHSANRNLIMQNERIIFMLVTKRAKVEGKKAYEERNNSVEASDNCMFAT